MDSKTKEIFEEIDKNGSLYEYLSLTKDPFYQECLRAIPIIKDFIRERKLIIYGGTAIDYALRLHGDKIYSDDMLSVPDLDFYSPNHVKDSQDLANILFSAGFTESRAIIGTYVRVMRVDIGNNHFLADISYIHKSVFDVLPYIEYEGMRVIHPIYQKIDAHRGISYPYDEPPREVVFARLKKDMKRFTLLNKYYPTEFDPAVFPQIISVGTPQSIIKRNVYDVKGLNHILHGFAAYAVLYQSLLGFKKMAKVEMEVPKEIIAANFAIDNDNFYFDAPIEGLDFVAYDSYDIIKDLGLRVEYYATNTNLFPDRAIDSAKKVCIWSIKNRLLGISTVDSMHNECFTQEVRVVSVSFLLLYMLVNAEYETMKEKGFVAPELKGRTFAKSGDKSGGLSTKQSGDKSGGLSTKQSGDKSVDKSSNMSTNKVNIYRAYYNSILKIIEYSQYLISQMQKSDFPDYLRKNIVNWPFFPSLIVYGKDNKSESYQIAKKRIDMEMKPVEKGSKSDLVFPYNYYPARGAPPKAFNYESSKFFIKDGRKMDTKLF